MKNDNETVLTSASFGFHALDMLLSIIEATGNAFEEDIRRMFSLVASTLHFVSSYCQLVLDIIQNNVSNIILSAVKFFVSLAKLAHAVYSTITDNHAFRAGSNLLNGIHTMFTIGHATARGIQFAQLNGDNDDPNHDRPKMQ